MTVDPKLIRSMPDDLLRQLTLACEREQRRRVRIRLKNAAWTAGPGLEATIEASITLSQKQKELK